MDGIQKIQRQEASAIIKEQIIAYFESAKPQVSSLIRTINDLSKRRPFNIWQLFFSLLLDYLKKPQPIERVKSVFSQVLTFFLEETADDQFCSTLQFLFAHMQRNNPNYAIFLTVMRELLEREDQLQKFLLIHFTASESLNRAYPEAYESIFLLDYFSALVILKVFVAFYSEERMKDQERLLIATMLEKIPTSFLWAFVFFGSPIWGAFKNLLPSSPTTASSASKSSLRAFLEFVGLKEKKAYRAVLDEILGVEAVPEWIACFWRDALLIGAENNGEEELDQAKLGQDAKIFNLLIEFLYPPKCQIVDHGAHVIHVQRMTPTTSIVKSLEGYFGEKKPSQKILSLLVSFDIEFVYDDETQTIRPRNTSSSAGYIAQFILNSPSISRHNFLVEYSTCIERLHQKYIASHQLNISLILLFRQTLSDSHSSAANDTESGSLKSIDFCDIFSADQKQPEKSILLFVGEFFSFEQVISLGNEYVLLEKILEHEGYLQDQQIAFEQMNWKDRKSCKLIFDRLLKKLIGTKGEQEPIEFVDPVASLQQDTLIYRKIEMLEAKSIYRFIEHFVEGIDFLNSTSTECTNLLLQADCTEESHLLALPPYPSVIPVLKGWKRIFSLSLSHYQFLFSLSRFLVKRFMQKTVERCFFDEAIEEFMWLEGQVFDLVVCDALEAYSNGSLRYDKNSFPATAILKTLKREGADHFSLFRSFTQMKVATKVHEKLVVDALFGLGKEAFACVISSLSDSQLVEVHRSEVVQYGTRKIAGISFVLAGTRVFSFEFSKIIFAIAQPFPAAEGIEQMKEYLGRASADEFRFFCRNFLSFADDVVLGGVGAGNEQISISFLSANALFVLCSLISKAEKSGESAQLQDVFEMFLSLNSFSKLFSAAKLNKEYLERFGVISKGESGDSTISFFWIILKTIKSPNSPFIQMMRDKFSNTPEWNFNSLLGIVNIHGKMNEFEQNLLLGFFSSRSAITAEMQEIACRHAERNPAFFLRLLSKAIQPHEIYKRIHQPLTKQGYIDNFIINTNLDLKADSNAFKGNVLLKELWNDSRLYDAIFWKKLTPKGWSALFELITCNLQVGHEFSHFLAGNLQHFDWLLDNIFCFLYENESEQIISNCLLFLGGEERSLLKSILQKASNSPLYLETTRRLCLSKGPDAVQLVVSRWLSPDKQRDCPLEILQLVNEVSEVAASFIDEPIMEAFAESFWEFVEHQASDQYRVALKVSIAAKTLEIRSAKGNDDEMLLGVDLFCKLERRVKELGFMFFEEFFGSLFVQCAEVGGTIV